MGFVALRFDFSGIGDSPARKDHLPFTQSAVGETRHVLDYLDKTRGIRQFVLLGICSGAVLSHTIALGDARVIGAVLINGAGHLHDSALGALPPHVASRTLLHYYVRIALHSSVRAKVWSTALSGRVDYAARAQRVLRLVRKRLFAPRREATTATDQAEARTRPLAERGVRVLHICSEADMSLDYLRVTLGDRLGEWSSRGWLDVRVIPGTNHTFTPLWKQREVVGVIGSWAQDLMSLGS
jgi:hypothetical protein